MPNPDMCTEEEIVAMVDNFYTAIREDETLGPVFNSHIDDWPGHLAIMYRFWSSVLRGGASYRGKPIPKHNALPELSPEHFHRWLAIFDETTAKMDNPAMVTVARDMAQRLAQSFWHAYRVNQEDPQRRAAHQAAHQNPHK